MLKSTGTLSCVGIGMTLGAHMTPIAREHITSSDLCFVAASDALVELWIQEMNPDVRSLQVYYDEGKSRKQTYREMVELVMREVRKGQKVCGAFYGHPGVFACVPHRLIKKARAEGFKAIMEPGISAEDCLIADLGIDPGQYGCQQYEASQFMFYKRIIDPSAYLILWQIGVAGDLTHGISVTGSQHRAVLLSLLYQNYPEDHPVIMYEAATLVIKQARSEEILLRDLINAELKDYTTLVIPPACSLTRNNELIKRIKDIKLVG